MNSANPSNVILTQGTLLGGKYRVDAPIAEGGMSLVLLGRDLAIDERVAIKLLKPEQRLQKDVLARFVREAKTIRRVQSERCVKVHDVGMDPVHGPFMVMEFLDGLSLRGILDSGGRFVPRRACELAIQICEALAAAHVIDCIHRDIKPDNIIVLQRGDVEDVRVLDFGISKHALTGSVLNQDISLINTISLMGSPAYMSPEQMRSTSKADPRSDIWSLGAVLFEMLTGRPPFVSESITELCTMVITDEPPLASSVDAAVSVPLAEIIVRCLRKNPNDRFQNVGDLARALMDHAPRRARMSLDRTLGVLGAAGVSFDDADDFREQTLILPNTSPRPMAPSGPALAVTPPPPPGSYPPPYASTPQGPYLAASSSNIAFVTPMTPRRPLSAMPTVVSLAKVEERRQSKLWVGGVVMLAVAAVLMLVAGLDARSRRHAQATAIRPNVEMPLPAPQAPGTSQATAKPAAAAAVVVTVTSAPVPAPVVVAPAETAVAVAPSEIAPAASASAKPASAKKPKSRVRVIED